MSSTDFRLDWLRTFVAIVDTGSITAATQKVSRSQSAVSMQLKKLEESVDQTLLVRGAVLTLTPAGYDLLGYARELLILHDRAVTAMHGGTLVGRISIGAPDDYVRTYLSPVLRSFVERYPRVQITTICESSTRLLERIRHGELDMAIMSRDMPSRGELLVREPLIWVGSEQYKLWEYKPLPIAVHGLDRHLRTAVLAAIASRQSGYRVVYNSPNVSGQLAMVESGLALAIITRCSLPVGLKELGVEQNLPELPEVEVALVRSTHTKQSPAVNAMHDHIIDLLGTLSHA